MNIKQKILPMLMPLARAYWKILKPKTFGVKALVLHPTDASKILLVLHAYGNRSLWNLPGGGFKPSKETSIQAGLREVREELGIGLIDTHELEVPYRTSGEGKQDTVSIITGVAMTYDISLLSPELTEAAWEDYRSVLGRNDIARVAKHAIRQKFSL